MTVNVSARPAAASARRAPLAWAAACAAGAGAVLLAAGRDWARVRYGAGSPLGEVTLTGADLVPYLGPAALAALAAVVAVLAARGVWRRLIGVAVAGCGAAAAIGALTGAGGGTVLKAAAERSALSAAGPATHEVAAAWPAATVAGGVVLLAGGVVAALFASRWPGMSERYERRGPGAPPSGRGPERRPTGPAAPAGGERELWDALDRGDDPTADPRGQDSP